MVSDETARAYRFARESRDPVALVKTALADHTVFKMVVQSLDQCEPDAEAARVVIEAHDRGEAPSWLTACLLAHVRHPDGSRKRSRSSDAAIDR